MSFYIYKYYYLYIILLNPTDYIYNLISSYSQIYLLIDLIAINYYPELKKYKNIIQFIIYYFFFATH